MAHQSSSEAAGDLGGTHAHWIIQVDHFYTEPTQIPADERRRCTGRGHARTPSFMQIRAPRAGTGARAANRATRWWSTMAARAQLLAMALARADAALSESGENAADIIYARARSMPDDNLEAQVAARFGSS
eukprot:6085829-Pyramimonas_sp.AAC.1